jgi:hypothetical protein
MEAALKLCTAAQALIYPPDAERATWAAVSTAFTFFCPMLGVYGPQSFSVAVLLWFCCGSVVVLLWFCCGFVAVFLAYIPVPTGCGEGDVGGRQNRVYVVDGRREDRAGEVEQGDEHLDLRVCVCVCVCLSVTPSLSVGGAGRGGSFFVCREGVQRLRCRRKTEGQSLRS